MSIMKLHSMEKCLLCFLMKIFCSMEVYDNCFFFHNMKSDDKRSFHAMKLSANFYSVLYKRLIDSFCQPG